MKDTPVGGMDGKMMSKTSGNYDMKMPMGDTMAMKKACPQGKSGKGAKTVMGDRVNVSMGGGKKIM